MNAYEASFTDDPPAISNLQKSPTVRIRAIPDVHQSIQANFCKTPGCLNFGVPPRIGPIKTGRGKTSSDGYAVVNTGSINLNCRLCGKNSTIKSNQAICEEIQRQGDLIWSEARVHCTNENCANHLLDCTSGQFRKFGSTKSSSSRFQCRACKTTFSIGKSTLRQRLPHKNTAIFELLVNKVPFNRICEIADISFDTLYRKIDFIYEQCRTFAADRERHLATMSFDRLYLSSDRQDYLVNWPDKKVRKTIQLTAVATADLASGYVFGFTPNYDPSIRQDVLEARWAATSDGENPAAMRQTARLWTLADYTAAAARSASTSSKTVEPVEDISDGQQLPKSGCQVHADYLVYGHYWLLRHHFQGAGKLRFFIDGDTGLLGACMSAFADRVNARTADVAIVMIDKELTVDARKASFAKATSWFAAEKQRFPSLSSKQVKSALMSEIIGALRAATPDKRIQNTWISSPFPDLAEPNKRIRFITDLSDYDDSHVANLLLKATLWPIDSVFNRIRRRLTVCERPVSCARRANCRWHIYAPYDPMTLSKALTIFRVWHNYVWISPKTKATAAQQLGLAQGKIRIQDILAFGRTIL